jgi:TBC1 domain family member 6
VLAQVLVLLLPLPPPVVSVSASAAPVDNYPLGQESVPMAEQDPNVTRNRSIKNREFGLYASRMPPPPKPVPASDVNAKPGTDPCTDPTPESPLTSPLPVSPRWDSLANGSSLIYPHSSLSTNLTITSTTPSTNNKYHPSPVHPSSTRQESAFPSPITPSTPLTPLTPSPTDEFVDSLSDVRYDRSSPGHFKQRPIEPRFGHDAMPVENFSRPRKSSIRLPAHEALRQLQPTLPSLDPYETSAEFYGQQDAWPRARRPSVSSAQSSATYASIQGQPPVDIYESRPPRSRHGQQHPMTRPTLSYGRVETGPLGMHSRDAAPWMGGGELRSSFRSQLTISTAQGTNITERSSVITKNSSVTSLYPSPDEPSVEDVMGMYEKGFRDDSGPEDDDDDIRPSTSRSEPGGRGVKPLEAVTNPLAPSMPLTIPNAEYVVRDSSAFFGGPGFPSSVPKDVGLADYNTSRRRSQDKRDSAKSLDTDETSPAPSTRQPLVNTTQSGPSIPEEADSRDRYGFRKQNQHISREQYDTWNSDYSQYLARRRKKWTAYLKENGLMTDNPNRFPPPTAKTKRFVRKGIPPDWRGAAWFYYAGGPAILAKHAGLYQELVDQPAKEVDVEAIERDLHRTFPDNIKFRPTTMAAQSADPNSRRYSQQTVTQTGSTEDSTQPEPEIITSLRRVLLAFSIYNPRIGYCQSLNFLAGLLLLFNDSEEQCFWLLNVITRVYLPGTHEMSLEGSKVDLGVFMNALKDAMPTVFIKIAGELDADPMGSRPVSRKSTRRVKSRKRDLPTISSERLPPITLCMTAWFMSCFIGTLPIESTLRVWDIFFYEGSKTLFRIALAIFKLGENDIKAVTDPMEMFSVVQTLPRKLIDANELMEACFKRRNGFGHLSQDTIDEKRKERRELGQAERLKLQLPGADDSGNITEAEVDMPRKGTLFGRKKKKKDIDEERPSEVH